MSIDNPPTIEVDQPEEPTNRPAADHRLKEWLSRGYVRRIIVLSIIIGVVIVPLAWVVIHFMNLSGAPASAIMASSSGLSHTAWIRVVLGFRNPSSCSRAIMVLP